VTETAPEDRTLEQWRLLLEQVEGRLKVQLEEVDGLDRKATTGLAATGVILGLVVNNVGSVTTAPDPVPLLFHGALVVLAAALVTGVFALWPRKLWVVPEPTPLLAQHAAGQPEHTVGELLSTKAAAYDLNVKLTDSKGDRVRFQMLLLAIGGGLLVGAYLLERLVK
jgi:hypothetical protein